MTNKSQNLVQALNKATEILESALLQFVKDFGIPFDDLPEYYGNKCGIYENKNEKVGNIYNISCQYVRSLNAPEEQFEYNFISHLYVVTDENGNECLRYYGFYNDGTALDKEGCEPIHGKVPDMTLDELYQIYIASKNI